MNTETIIWLVITVLALIIEGSTAGLTTIWFAVAGAVSFVLSLFSTNVYVQIVVFFLVSILLLVFTRPIIKKTLVKQKEKTNADKIIGEKALVIEEINEFAGTGQIKISGAVWSAKANDVIAKDEKVIIKETKGVHAIVEREEN